MANPIKDKFIEHMELFGLTKETQKGYISVQSLVEVDDGSHELNTIAEFQGPLAERSL